MKTFRLSLFTLAALLLLVSAKPVSAEVSIKSSVEGDGNCSNHIKSTVNGVTTEKFSTDCNSELTLDSTDSNPGSTTSPNTTSSPTSRPTTHPSATFQATPSPTPGPTEAASPSATPTSTDSASPTLDQKSFLDKVLDTISGFFGSIFGG